MNIFQRIKEVKLPFLAVIAALVFGGIVAPANAAPVVSAVTVSDTTLSIAVDLASQCKYVVRLDNAVAPANWSEIDMASPSSTNLAVGSTTGGYTASPSVNVGGLQNGTSYKAWVYCWDSPGSNSNVVASAAFVPSGPTASNISVTAITNGGATVSFTQNRYGSGQGCMAKLRLRTTAAFSASQVLDYNQTSLAFSSFVNNGNPSVSWVITGKTAGTNYSVDIACQDMAVRSQVYTVDFTTTGVAPSNNNSSNNSNNQQAPTTAAVQRPLPQISFVAPSTPGFSARPTSDTRKGTLTLQGENFSDLTAITIGGKAATFTVKDGKLEIKLPAGVTGFPEMVMTNGGGSITMQNAIEIFENKVQKLTRFVGNRFTKAGLEQLENACIQNKEANSIEAVVVVAADATEADYANAVKAATDAAAYLDKVSKRISHTSVTVAKTGEAGSKPTVEMNFTKN